MYIEPEFDKLSAGDCGRVVAVLKSFRVFHKALKIALRYRDHPMSSPMGWHLSISEVCGKVVRSATPSRKTKRPINDFRGRFALGVSRKALIMERVDIFEKGKVSGKADSPLPVFVGILNLRRQASDSSSGEILRAFPVTMR